MAPAYLPTLSCCVLRVMSTSCFDAASIVFSRHCDIMRAVCSVRGIIMWEQNCISQFLVRTILFLMDQELCCRKIILWLVETGNKVLRLLSSVRKLEFNLVALQLFALLLQRCILVMLLIPARRLNRSRGFTNSKLASSAVAASTNVAPFHINGVKLH